MVKTGPPSEPTSERSRTASPMQEPELKRGDIAVTNYKVLLRNGKLYRVIVELMGYVWIASNQELVWKCLTHASSGEKFAMVVADKHLTRLDIKFGDEIKLVVDGEEVTGVVGRVFVDEENEVSCKVHSLTIVSKVDKVMKV